MSARATNLSNSRIRVALLALVILLLSTSTPSPNASAGVGCVWYWRARYFTDATMTTQCGMTAYMCDGEVAQGGCVTEYVITYTCECLPGHTTP